MKFREAFLTGSTPFDTIFDLTDEWNFSDETCTLREYLGLTPEEEDVWVSQSDEALEDLMEQEKNRRLFFTDIDGTLLTDRKELTPRAAEYLDKALAQGHQIILTTGRAPASTLLQARRMHLNKKGCYVICCNGAQTLDSATGEILASSGVPHPVIRRCFEEAEKAGIYLQSYDNDQILTQFDSPYLYTYARILEMDYKIVPDVEASLPADYCPPKLLALDSSHERLVEFRERLNAIYSDVLDIVFSQDTYLEIVCKGVNKGAAVKDVARMLQVPLALCVAAGDSENDIPMIKAAGVGAAMANAEDAVKEAADYVSTLDNNHDGIAEIIENLVLHK